MSGCPLGACLCRVSVAPPACPQPAALLRSRKWRGAVSVCGVLQSAPLLAAELPSVGETQREVARPSPSSGAWWVGGLTTAGLAARIHSTHVAALLRRHLP